MRPNRTKNSSQEPVLVRFGFGFFRFRELDFKTLHIAGKLSLCIGLPIMICHNFATELCITKGQEGYVYRWQSTIGSKKQRILDTLFVKLKNPPSLIQINGLPENVVPITASTNVVKAALVKDTSV
jgi:hypothetical protein